MIPQIRPEVYQTGFNYLTFGIPPIETISISCEHCHSRELVILSRTKEVTKHPLHDEIKGTFTFYCPYCLHVEEVKIESVCIRNITMKDIADASKEKS